MIIKKFEAKYRDDLIFMVLSAKNALGRVPGLNEDLLNIQSNYFDKGDMFWIAVDENDRVIGSIGYNSIDNTSEIVLHRLFIKPDLKHRGIGTKLLRVVEDYARLSGKTAIYVHLGSSKEQWFESYNFYPKNGFTGYDDNKPYVMRKIL